MTKTLRLRSVDLSILKAKAFNKIKCRFIEIYIVEFKIRDDRKREHVSTQIFYSFLEMIHNIIVRLSWLRETNFHVDWITLTWRYEIELDRITLDFLKKFLTREDQKTFIYVLICNQVNDATRNLEFASSSRRVLDDLFAYIDRFSKRNISRLFEHDKENHIIDFMFDKNFFRLFTNISKKKLMYLREYIVENKTLNRIREFVNRASAFVLFISKKNDNFRLCVDYRDLNAITIKNRHSLSLIEKTLNRLIDVVYFIKLNLKNVYHRIRIRKNDEWKIAFRTRYEHFEYIVMSFDLTNASVIFQALINKILKNLINYICVIYLNDILIYFKTRKKHWDHVRQILERLKQFKLYVKFSKCIFMMSQVEFLRYIIERNEIAMNSSRVDVIWT